MTGWEPVHGRDGKVLGWLSAPDPDEDPGGDYFTGARLAVIRRRAAAIDQAADLLMHEEFDVEDTWAAAEAAGMPPGMIDSAGNVALVLRWIEMLRQ